MRLDRISIHTTFQRVVVDADVAGHWAMHRSFNCDVDEWSVTHVPTGFVACRFDAASSARSAVASLAMYVPAPTKGKAMKQRGIIEAIMACAAEGERL